MIFDNSDFHIFQGMFLEIEFDFKGDPMGATITNCKQMELK